MNAMKKRLMVIFLMQAPICSAEDLNLGIFSLSENHVCAAFGNLTPKSGDLVKLVSTDPAEPIVEAKVGVIAGSCPRLESSMVSGPYFKIEVPTGAEAPPFGFSILGSGKLTNGKGVRVWRSEILEKPIYLRSCASSEGLHLTAWESPKISNHAKWHRYVSLGYDLEPNCSESEIE